MQRVDRGLEDWQRHREAFAEAFAERSSNKLAMKRGSVVLLSGTEGDKEDEAQEGREDEEQKNKQMEGGPRGHAIGLGQ